MKLNNKKPLATIVFVLVLTSAFLASANFASAVTISTRAFLSANPNPVQVGKDLVVSFWIEPIPPTAADRLHGFQVTVIRPDGTSETRGPFESSPLGSQYFVYVPTMTGSYQVKFNYPGETFAGGVVYAAAESPVTQVTVQTEPLPQFQEAPVPNDFWTRPINAQNRGWFSISGNWLMRNYNATYRSFGEVVAANPFSQAPRAPHVMWTKPLTMGGLIGGDFGAESYYTGQSYEPKITPPIIINGRLFYNIFPTSLFGAKGQGFVCVDLRTGEEIWRNNNWTVTLGQVYTFYSGNEAGGEAFLWKVDSPGIFGPPIATYHMFDAFTGNYILTFANGMPGTTYFGRDGTMFVDVLNGQAGWHALWNSTKALEANFMIIGTEPGITMLEPQPGVYQWSSGIQWNVTIPVRSVVLPEDGLTYYPSQGFMSGITGNVMVASAGTVTDARLHVGYDLTTGRELWAFDRSNEASDFIVFAAFGEGSYCQWDTLNMRWICYDAQTGAKKWVSDSNVYPWGAFLPNSNGGTIYQGMLYSAGMDGYLHAFDMSNGKEVWKFYAGDTTETAYGTYPMGSGPIVAAGVVYCGVGEHSPTHPLYRGGKLFAIDAKTGKELWNVNGYFSVQAIADGYLVAQNQYDNQIYVFGKGPSKTTVSVSPASTARGNAVVIQGKVTDESSGQPGTPAISDRDMGQWIAYTKEQQVLPEIVNIAGVPVILTAVGPDGSTINIGETTSDASGNYFMAWTPPSTGLFKVGATFVGSDSFGSSYDEAAVVVNSGGAPSVTSPSVPPSGMMPSAELYYILVAVIVVVIVVVVVAIVMRRRK
ncbi:MAG: PQQ-binding-like beta-propeller repeat protein [Candidatus Bathyarchaeia archaeon]